MQPTLTPSCFAGTWTGRGVQGHRSASVKLTVEQHGERLRAVLEWVEFGKPTTETLEGRADCTARTATAMGRWTGAAIDEVPREYHLLVNADAARMTDGGTESRLDGTWRAGDDVGEVEAYRRNQP